MTRDLRFAAVRSGPAAHSICVFQIPDDDVTEISEATEITDATDVSEASDLENKKKVRLVFD